MGFFFGDHLEGVELLAEEEGHGAGLRRVEGLVGGFFLLLLGGLGEGEGEEGEEEEGG